MSGATATGDEIRERYLAFFAARGHRRRPSAGLVPENDPTLLFIGAGMAPFKRQFLGIGPIPDRRVTTSQKCIRTGDIESVGRTPRHLTFFEMMGNFSFGDYFKREAITWAWEFLREELGVDAERLRVSVFREDEEAARVWEKDVGLSPSRITRAGAETNFWPANAPAEGPNGPCGPCSEIFFDRGAEYGCGSRECDVMCDCDRFVEIWNLVFTQYERRDGGVLEPLPQKNIDTGMGLERVTATLQGASSVFETDLLRPIVERVEGVLGVERGVGGEAAARIHRIADHARAVVFALADGVRPSNEGRGYVVRRLIRRALRDRMELQRDVPMLHGIGEAVIERMAPAYPQLRPAAASILATLSGEEGRFTETVRQGLKVLDEVVALLRHRGEKTLVGDEAFRLYDTYGFPLELAEGVLGAHGMQVDHAGFERAMERQRKQARGASTMSGEIFVKGPWGRLGQIADETRFVGYNRLGTKGKVLGVVPAEGGEGGLLTEARHGARVAVLLDKTTFYGEGGGQVGDAGRLRWAGGEMRVMDTRKLDGLVVHIGEVQEGILHPGLEVSAEVDEHRRESVARNHTATHLLHAALQEILGAGAAQAGSLVAPDRLRFDFSHAQALQPEQSREIAEIVNREILADTSVESKEMTIEESRKVGAKAMFGEKYGDRVRVITIGSFSVELCGGTHVGRTGQIGPFLLVGESSVGAGARRVEALTGFGALRRFEEQHASLRELEEVLGGSTAELAARARKLVEERKAAVRQARSGAGEGVPVDRLWQEAEAVGGVQLVRGVCPGAGADALRAGWDRLRERGGAEAAVLGGDSDGRPALLVGFSKELVERGLDAGKVIGSPASRMGGGGGGRADLAQAGGKDASRLGEAVEAAYEAVREGLERSGR
ncbi:MAG: alanine--tRNA ligase [Planctomycetes bacterium]|nr:alanine--tRNA ligase [Planctomycetota bacterium]